MTDHTPTVFVAVLGTRNQQVALVRAGDHWALPQAQLATGASPEQTALSAAQAALGLPVTLDRLSETRHDAQSLLLIYRANLGEGAPHAAVSFFAPAQLPVVTAPLQRAALEAWAQSVPSLTAFRPNYCTRCGSPRLAQQIRFGRARLTCEACGFVFFRDPKVGAGVFIIEQGRVLLVQRGVNPGMDLWCFPSGFIEHDESPERAAAREAKEETGLDVAIDELMNLHAYLDPGRGNGILILYRAHAVGGELQPGDDAKAVRYFAPRELPPPIQIAFRTHRLVLQEWRAKNLKREA